jgi:hypothetical protein
LDDDFHLPRAFRHVVGGGRELDDAGGLKPQPEEYR